MQALRSTAAASSSGRERSTTGTCQQGEAHKWGGGVLVGDTRAGLAAPGICTDTHTSCGLWGSPQEAGLVCARGRTAGHCSRSHLARQGYGSGRAADAVLVRTHMDAPAALARRAGGTAASSPGVAEQQAGARPNRGTPGLPHTASALTAECCTVMPIE